MRYRTWTLPVILISFLSYNYSQNINLNYKNCNGCPQGANTNTPINNALFVYGNPTSFVIDDLESDFDLRRAGGNTRWHKGLDFRNHGQGADQQRGDAILSPEIGTILDIDHTGYKYVIVDGANYDFGYGHIFSHNNINNTSIWRSGNFVLKMTELDQNNQRFPVIINLDNCTAFCRETNKTVILSNIHCEDTLTTTNHINLDSVFCPIGGSRGSLTDDFPVHLHLYKFRNPANGISLSNCSDPLIHIQHPYTAYDLEIALNSDIEPPFSNWNNNNIEYPGNEKNTFSLRTTMDNAQQGIDPSRYLNVAHNLDEIQIMIKNKFQSEFKLVEGPHYRSEFLLHAQLNTPLYPDNLHDHYGDQHTTGASPSAYRDNVGFRPFDNYYYANFITRIHKNDPMDGATTPTLIANCPQDARYNDGEYELKARVTDVRGNEFEGPMEQGVLTPVEFTLDNFQPFIQSVTFGAGPAGFPTPTVVTNQEWTCGEDGCISLSEPTIVEVERSSWYAFVDNSSLRIKVKASEPLGNLTLNLQQGVNMIAEDIEAVEVDAAEQNFLFDISNYVNELSGQIQLSFDGYDKSNNPLLNFVDFLNGPTPPSCLSVPTRTSTDPNGWDNPDQIPSGGGDFTYSICIDCGANLVENTCMSIILTDDEADCITVNATIEDVSEPGLSDGSISLDINQAIEPLEIIWGDGTASISRENLPAGEYCVWITDAFCCQYQECFLVGGGCSDFEKPYLKRVKVWVDNTLIYNGSWSNTNGCVDFSLDDNLQPDQNTIHAIQQGAEVKIGARSNTALDWLTLALPGTGIIELGSNASPSSGENWLFNFPNGIPNISTSNTGIEQLLSFNGQSLEGEELLDFNAMSANSNDCIILPVLQNDCTWQPTGEVGNDEVHQIIIEGCEGLTSDISTICPKITPVSECGLSNGSIGFIGSCSFGGELPYTYLWSNGTTTLNNNNLSGGFYTLTVTDAFGCQGTFEYFVPSYGEPLIDQSQTSVVNSCSGQNNGRIIVALSLIDPGNSGNEPPIDASFEWSNGTIVQNDFFSIQENLSPGTYTVTITNLATQCSIVEDFTVQEVASDAPLNVAAETLGDICYGSSGGSVKLTITGGVPPYYRNGAEISGSILQINHQYPEGQHCETITDHCGESYQVCFDIEVIESSIFTIFLADIDHVSSSGANDGSASISVVPDGDYSYQWLPYSSFLGTNPSVDGLEAGNYTVRVEDNLSGCTQVLDIQIQECKDVPDFDVKLFGGFIDPANQSESVSFYASITEDGQPLTFVPSNYVIQWSINGTPVDHQGFQLFVSPTLLLSDDDPVVQVVVDNGCTVKFASREIYNCQNDAAAIDFFVAEEIKPCSGSSEGEIQIVIPNIYLTSTPENLSVEVLVAGVAVPIELLPYAEGTAFTATVGGLSSGSYDFIVNVGADCQATFTYELGESAPEPVYDRYENEPAPACIYKLFCGEGQEVGETSQVPILDLDNAEKRKCRVPIVCNNEATGYYKEYEVVTCRVAQYEDILQIIEANNPGDYGFLPGYIDELQHHIQPEKDCAWVKFCTGTLEVIATWGNWNGNIVDQVVLPNGCTRYRCSGGFFGLNSSFKVCPNDNSGCNTLPFISLQEPPEPDLFCPNVVSFNLYGLLNAMDNGLLDEDTEFWTSTLYNELLNFQPENPDAAKCMEVVFCKEGYEFKYFNTYSQIETLCSDVNILQYNPTQIPDTNPFDDNGSEVTFEPVEEITLPTCEVVSGIVNENGELIQEVIRCRTEECDKYETSIVLDDCTSIHIINYGDLSDIFNIDNLVPSDTMICFMQDNYGAERLRSLSTLTFEGMTIPKPVLDASLNRRIFYDFTPFSEGTLKREDNGLITQIENWDTHQSLYVFEETQGISISYEDSITTWVNILNPSIDSALIINEVALAGEGFIQITGEFKGSLSWGEEDLISSENMSLFILQLDLFGQVIGLDFVEGINTTNRNATMSTESDGSGVLLTKMGSSNNSEVILNGAGIGNVPSFDANGLGVILWDAATRAFSTLKFLDISETSTLIGAVQKEGKTMLMLKGTRSDGISSFENKLQIPMDSTSSTLVYLNTDGEMLWSKDIFGEQVYNIETVFMENGGVAIGITYSGTIAVDGNEFTSNGGLDILILSLSSTGDLLSSNPYGSQDSETIEVMFIDSDILYFGGHFFGSETTRYVGNKIFKDFSPYGPEVYMSEIFLNQPQMTASEKTTKKDIFVPKTLENQLNLTSVYPNPSSGEIHLSIFSNETQQQVLLEMTDMTGRTVENWGKLPLVKGSNNLNITPSPLIGPGVYLLKIIPVNLLQQTIITKIIRL